MSRTAFRPDMTDDERRALQRELKARAGQAAAARIDEWRASLVKPNHLSERRRRAEEVAVLKAEQDTRRGLRGMAALRADLEAFASGQDDLFGFPRHLVDWPALWAYCERNEQ